MAKRQRHDGMTPLSFATVAGPKHLQSVTPATRKRSAAAIGRVSQTALPTASVVDGRAYKWSEADGDLPRGFVGYRHECKGGPICSTCGTFLVRGMTRHERWEKKVGGRSLGIDAHVTTGTTADAIAAQAHTQMLHAGTHATYRATRGPQTFHHGLWGTTPDLVVGRGRRGGPENVGTRRQR